jgi:hypothetical protein
MDWRSGSATNLQTLDRRLAVAAVQRDTERAMSQENVEIVRQGIDAWNRGDRDEWLAGWARK